MSPRHQFVRVHFHRFKAFKDFTLNITPFNILVGPNNSGKSTILTAFRILAAGIRKATAKRKEIENFLLVPQAMNRAAARKLADQNRRTGKSVAYTTDVSEVLAAFAKEKKSYVLAQNLAKRKIFDRAAGHKLDDATVNERAFNEFETQWAIDEVRLAMIPGKEALSAVNQVLQNKYGVTITPIGIVDAMEVSEVPEEMRTLVTSIKEFVSGPLPV